MPFLVVLLASVLAGYCSGNERKVRVYYPNKSQEDAILSMLIDAKGCWVSLPLLLRARGENTIIANIGARMTGLRKKNYIIENQKTTIGGVVHSEYRITMEQQTSMAI